MVIHGKVIKGLGIGKKLGYPTANLEIHFSKLSFVRRCRTKLSFRRKRGIYAARATVAGAVHNAVAVIGARQERGKPLVEIHFLDFSGDLQGKTLAVDVFEKISEIEIFKDEEALKKKIEEDIRKARLCLQE